jgi:hypothetical protein
MPRKGARHELKHLSRHYDAGLTRVAHAGGSSSYGLHRCMPMSPSEKKTLKEILFLKDSKDRKDCFKEG